MDSAAVPAEEAALAAKPEKEDCEVMEGIILLMCLVLLIDTLLMSAAIFMLQEQ